MANTDTDKQAAQIRQAKYEGFIRHTNLTNDAATTEKKFARYVEQDRKREEKFKNLHKNILEGLKA